MNPLLLAAVLALMLLAGSGDYQHEQDILAHECEMNHIWLEEAFANVPVHDRAGWPISNHEYQRKCGVESASSHKCASMKGCYQPGIMVAYYSGNDCREFPWEWGCINELVAFLYK